MPYTHKKTGKNEVTVYKKDSGEVVGHTTPGKLNDYLAALHMHADDAKGMAKGGVVEAPRKILPPMMAMADGGEVPDLSDLPTPDENAPPVAPPASPVAPASPIPSILAGAQGLGAQAAGGYTPQMRNQLYAAMLQRANTTPMAVGNTLASVGDAIARGYGRDQGANFLQNSLQNTQKTREEGLGAFDATQKMALAQTQAGMELGKMDPNSALSKMSQEAFSGPLKKLGYGDADIAKMPASQIEAVTNVALKYGDIQAQKELKEATLELTAKMNEAQIGNMKAQQQARQDELKRQQEEANKALDVEASSHWLAHPFLAAQARSRLAQGAAGAAAPTAVEAPHGMTVVQNGHTYTWNPQTKKYE